jgi:cobalt-zinc-cadmium efflux system outer membrane protein
MRATKVKRAVLVLATFGLAGCASEPWSKALDEAPDEAALATGISEDEPLKGPNAAPASAQGADSSPAYLGPGHANDNERETNEIRKHPILSLTDVVRLAELNSKDLLASYEAIVAAHGSVIAASVYPNPSIAFSSGAISAHGLYSQANGGPSHAIPLMPQAAYTFTQPVVTGLRLVWARREAVANEWAARATWQVLHRGNVQAVKTAYVNLLFAKQNLELQEDLLRFAADLDGIAEKQFVAGVLNAADRGAAAVALAQQRGVTEAARQAIPSAEALLAGLTGGIPVAASQVTALLTGELNMAAEESLENVLEHGHPVLRAAQLAVSAAKADTHLQRAVIWPDVGVSLGYERDYLDSPPNRTFDTINFGLSFTLPIWDHNQGQIITSDANLRAADATLEFTLQGLRSNLRSAYANVLAEKRQAEELSKNIIPVAEKTLELTRKSFETGQSRIIDVLNARQNLAAAKNNLLTALQTLDQSIAGIENLTGEKLLAIE